VNGQRRAQSGDSLRRRIVVERAEKVLGDVRALRRRPAHAADADNKPLTQGV
jgi:hypothetical protein